ncbi:MAG: DJ-1 family glyoxalase III [Planctomycetota bacterium]|jgi:4-methyl-5(b-hydroxyethyl)-thiazole monophosphate biosynthesis
MTSPRACVLFAEGFEEIEAVTLVDVLRRAEIETVSVGVGARDVTGSHGITVRTDATLAETAARRWDLVVLPGGMPGAANLRDDAGVQALLAAQHAAGRRIAAICAAPIALAPAGVLEGRRATSYPGYADQLGGARYVEESVVVDGPLITSRGPGTALPFALALVAELAGAERAEALGRAMLAPAGG